MAMATSNARFMSGAYMRQLQAEAAEERRRLKEEQAAEAIARKKERERGAIASTLPPLNINLEAGNSPVSTPERKSGGARSRKQSRKNRQRKTRSRR